MIWSYLTLLHFISCTGPLDGLSVPQVPVEYNIALRRKDKGCEELRTQRPGLQPPTLPMLARERRIMHTTPQRVCGMELSSSERLVPRSDEH